MPNFAPDTKDARPVHILDFKDLDEWQRTADEAAKTWSTGQAFKASYGSFCIIPDGAGGVERVLVGMGDTKARRRSRFLLAGVAPKLPAGTYRIASNHEMDVLEEEALGWLLSHYSFERYKSRPSHGAQLVCPDQLDASRLEHRAAGEFLTRDLINTPTNDMGPPELEEAARNLANQFGAAIEVVEGEDLLSQNFPMIHTVGRASASAPRLIDMTWGEVGPSLTLVGKGVCFDTGGLNIKPGASMGLMKKDMGGAAAVLGLARMIMGTGLPLRLRVLIPAVENSIDGSAFRPGDILTSRKGLTVEINNTDAEGRLVLADALALADESAPDLLICMATLTGAARVAVGPDLAPFYTDDDTLAEALKTAASTSRDPVWQMPFHDPYEQMIEPGIADLDNAPAGGFAGSVTAALFLRRFVENAKSFAHFDIYGWQPKPAPGRPKGGVGQGTRAIMDALPEILQL